MIPVHRPLLPTKKCLEPYLDEIDHARWYSNFGSLVNKFESRLANHFGVAHEMLTTAANGTLMLISIMKALNIPENSLCIMPAWTFVATAAAACYAGLIPYFVDVDQNSQALQPFKVKEQLYLIKQRIGVVIVVAPFGAPIDRVAWDNFSDETGIPVIIDAAAAFDVITTIPQMSVGKSPMMVSMHATKVFGIGEGGLVLSIDAQLIKKIKLNTSFGFNAYCESLTIGYNAKLSEYTAAMGLAALDNWEHTRSQWIKVRDKYILELDKHEIAHWFSSNWISGTCNVILPDYADAAMSYLRKAEIDTRKWWGNGCHQHQAYLHFPRSDDLSVTEWLSLSVLGVPFTLDLESSTTEYICSHLKEMQRIIDG